MNECADQRRLDIKLLCELDGVFPHNQAASGGLCCRGGACVAKIMKTWPAPFCVHFSYGRSDAKAVKDKN